jgi:hypothetical protein
MVRPRAGSERGTMHNPPRHAFKLMVGTKSTLSNRAAFSGAMGLVEPWHNAR